MATTDTHQLVTRSGVTLHVRRAQAEDAPALAEFFHQVTPEDLRFRFLTSVREVGADRLAMMTAPDPHTDSLLALNAAGELLATALLVGDAEGRRGEVAVTLRSDHKALGIGWSLLEHLVTLARERGYQVVESLEDRQNRSAISLEREMGFSAIPVEDDPTLLIIRRELA
jgi:GNAT superfamily N-acetyltransferase